MPIHLSFTARCGTTTLKFQPDRLDGVNVISSYANQLVGVNWQPWQHSVLVPWQGEVQAWGGPDLAPASLTELTAAHFASLLTWQPEVVIYGSGPTLKFPAPALMRALIEARIGFETMDTGAACRTYNVLAAEGRRVLAALLIG